MSNRLVCHSAAGKSQVRFGLWSYSPNVRAQILRDMHDGGSCHARVLGKFCGCGEPVQAMGR